MGGKTRLDRLLVDRELVESRTRAQALIMAGKVEVEGRRVDKPGTAVPDDARIEVKGPDHPFVSRGGLKLQGALQAFGEGRQDEPRLDVAGKVAMDVGASTGGFTDCLLQHGAARVHAVDVGYGQLAWKLASDPRVVVHDRQNIRKLETDAIGEAVELAVVDCSFIALAKVIPHLPRFLTPSADVVALVKPQFELDPERVGKGGIVRDEADRRAAVDAARAAADAAGFDVLDTCDSPITGREGNVEYLLWLRRRPESATPPASP
jgi:23S rRNA (cytidine1920-2'-O)/16S rRNA (cytidine1409-2'-O)-methyltransferase